MSRNYLRIITNTSFLTAHIEKATENLHKRLRNEMLKYEHLFEEETNNLRTFFVIILGH